MLNRIHSLQFVQPTFNHFLQVLKDLFFHLFILWFNLVLVDLLPYFESLIVEFFGYVFQLRSILLVHARIQQLQKPTYVGVHCASQLKKIFFLLLQLESLFERDLDITLSICYDYVSIQSYHFIGNSILLGCSNTSSSLMKSKTNSLSPFHLRSNGLTFCGFFTFLFFIYCTLEA